MKPREWFGQQDEFGDWIFAQDVKDLGDRFTRTTLIRTREVLPDEPDYKAENVRLREAVMVYARAIEFYAEHTHLVLNHERGVMFNFDIPGGFAPPYLAQAENGFMARAARAKVKEILGND